MSNKKLGSGILAMVLVFGITVVGCDNPTNNRGPGWEPTDVPPVEGDVSADWTTLSFEFDGSSVELTRSGGSAGSLNGQWTGTVDGTSVRMTVTGANWTMTDTSNNNIARGTVTISGTNLTFTITHMWDTGGGNGDAGGPGSIVVPPDRDVDAGGDDPGWLLPPAWSALESWSQLHGTWFRNTAGTSSP